MIKKAYDQSKNFVFVFAVFSMIFYTVGATTLTQATENISKIPVIIEMISNLGKKQDLLIDEQSDCKDRAFQCDHDITVLQGFHK